MSMTFLQAKQAVARLVGGSAVSSQLTVAGASILDAIRDFDLRNDWEFKLITLTDITVSANVAAYDLKTLGGATNPKKIYSARFKNNKRTLFYVRQREVDRAIRDQENVEIPIAYTEIRSANGNLNIKLIPTPSGGELLQVRIYEHIVLPSADGDVIDIPDRYLGALLALARYYFVIDRDPEDARAQSMLAKSEQLIMNAVNDDRGNPDEDFRLIPMSEWVRAQGPDPLNDLFGFEF